MSDAEVPETSGDVAYITLVGPEGQMVYAGQPVPGWDDALLARWRADGAIGPPPADDSEGGEE